MTHRFFDSFEPETLIKLQIFQGYIRDWLPVFLNKGTTCRRVHVLDLFAGPGRDGSGAMGTPLLCVEAVRDYCRNSKDNRNFARVHMYFNDMDSSHVAALKNAVEDRRCQDSCCEYHFTSEDFAAAFLRIFQTLDPADPALVILDPFGFQVSIEIIRKVVQRKRTDLLLFYPSGIARRFGDDLELTSRLAMTSEEIQSLQDEDHYHAHRIIGQLIKKKITTTTDYWIAPFSIRRGSNIYGIFFGSANLSGIERFLDVCWKTDPRTGEANYNIDRVPRQLPLFEADAKRTKRDRFSEELLSFIGEKHPSNCELTHFCYRNGFSKKIAAEILRRLNEDGLLVVWDNSEQKLARRNSFYLGHEHCKSDPAKVTFSIREDTPHV